MSETCNKPSYAPHLWIIFYTTLALTLVYLVEIFAPRLPLAGAASPTILTFSHPGGYYDHGIRLEINAPASATNVIFTLDGSIPTHTTGSIYTTPIRLNTATLSVTVVRARTVSLSGELGPVISASYFVGMLTELPMISLIIDPDDLWGTERGIYTNPNERGITWERPVDVTYVGRNRRSGFHIPAGIRIHGEGSRGYEKKSLRLYFRQEYGVARLDYPLFDDSDVHSFKRLVLHSGGQDYPVAHRWNWTLMRNPLADRLAFQLGGHATHSQPALLFINGKLWGIYQIRERIDGRFLTDHYGIETADFLESPVSFQNGDVFAKDESWDHLLQFVTTHDLSDPASYAYVQSQIDVANLIDYTILQIYIANMDWPTRNGIQFRPEGQGGRWQWMFWNSSSGFGANPSGHIDSNVLIRLWNTTDPETPERDTLLLRKLLENPEFLEQFLSRTADLLNTELAPSSVIAHIDSLAAELEPDIAYETIRWPSSTTWETNVQELHDFARHRPDFVRRHIVESFDLKGATQLTFLPPVEGSGHVAVNGLPVQDLPWQGVYFQGIPVQITAVPAPGYRFAGWDPPTLPQPPTITLTLGIAQTITPSFELTGEDAPRPGDVVFTEYQMDRNSHIEGTWFELQVARSGDVDLRGWRVTDNDTKAATDEGSLIFADNPAFARVPHGTTIVIVVNQASDINMPQDDLNAWDQQMVLYVGNGNLDTSLDPGFNLGPNDNLVLLTPGLTGEFGDDQGIAFVSESTTVTSASFGVLTDGVLTSQ